MARTTTTVRPPWDLIEKAFEQASLNNEKPTREYIKKVLAEKYDYTVDYAIDRGLRWGVLDGIYHQRGDAFYISKSHD
jgi:hypothetical protein